MCPEQITFDTVKKEKTVCEKTVKKVELPENLKDTDKMSPGEFIEKVLGTATICDRRCIESDAYTFKDGVFSKVKRETNTFQIPSTYDKLDLITIDDDLNIFVTPARFNVKYTWESGHSKIADISIEVEKTTPIKKLPVFPVLINKNIDELYNKMTERYPYLTDWVKDINPYSLYYKTDAVKKENVLRALMFPEAEILTKAGYSFVDVFFKRYSWDRSNTLAKEYNLLINRGESKPSTIFKCSKEVYSALKSACDIKRWNEIRKMDKFGRIPKSAIELVATREYDSKTLQSMSSILKQKYDDKPVFTWSSLLNYLERVDTYEAIYPTEALQLLSDYLRMCNELRIEPKTDGDSLKREHDVTARLFSQRRDEIQAEKLKRALNYDYLNYEDDKYIIRAIRDYDDLMDEAKQQHNCLACYATQIIKGNSKIFVMREKDNPDKSFISIELSPDGDYVRQKYLAFNRPVTNTKTLSVINKWHQSVKEKIIKEDKEKIA